MHYNTFIESIKRCQTARVKALDYEFSCAMANLPIDILSQIPKLVQLLDQNHAALSKKNHIIYWFGLQPCALKIKNQKSPCCVIKYLSVESSTKAPTSWDGEDNLVIDFETGQLMDNQQYLSMLFTSVPPGKVYGGLYES